VYGRLINSNLNDINVYQYNTFFDGDQMVCAYDDLTAIVNAFANGRLEELESEADRVKIRGALAGLNANSNPVLIRYKLRENSTL
jgi:hypothetical protein